ncbi:hydrophobin 3 [Dissoconium aciculare CBS 342.82]|uniref:Hydrophobin 3 n=1 Tax=Dissoconium aciculare CBS 342.82 TaxID=1314786 RepID=A0A6J3MDB2_9PEZI|nr:hydrophobin 3 [Dissoconium aciculare CBS 342.82]KAF1826006.1 hydrophobin 3 [Dissoconium aciculare CBS 342.82]
MQFSTIFTIIASAVAVSAMPAIGNAPGNIGSCNSQTTIACCNGENSSGLLGNILGGNCVLPNLLSLGAACPASNTFCCPTTQNGELNINLSCIPITL